MQEETTQKTISLVIKGGKINAKVLQESIRFFLRQAGKHSAKRKSTPHHGKQTMKQLTAQTGKLTNIQVTEQNIGSFDRVARKYSIDYALKKDKTVEPPVYYVFFKAKDLDVMTAAFKEYTAAVSKKKTRPSVLQKLSKALETVRDNVVHHTSQHYRLEDALLKTYPREIAECTSLIAGLKADIATAQEKMPDAEHFQITISGRGYTDKKEAGAAIIAACSSLKTVDTGGAIGEYAGFTLKAQFDSFTQQFRLFVKCCPSGAVRNVPSNHML